MKRRDFLKFRSTGGRQIMLLSCQRLFIGYSDARSQPGIKDYDLYSGDDSGDGDWWCSEPPLAVEPQRVEQLFAELTEELVQADVLILEDREWLQDENFSRQVTKLLSRFRAQGGEVRYSAKNSGTDLRSEFRPETREAI